MKRSEMIDLLDKYFSDQLGFVSSVKKGGVRHISEDVLKLVEKAGMEPPQLPNVSSYDLAMGGNYNKWEN